MLAELFAADPDVCTWHLTEAALGPDEQVAAQVEAAADRVLQRGDAVAAVRALIRAAELSPEGPARARRLSGAAYVGASDVGALASSAALLRQARVADPSQEDSLSSAVAAAFLMVNSDGDIDTAHLLLVAALDAHPAGSADHVVEEALNTLSMLCFNSGRRDWWESLQAAVQRHSATLAPAFVLMAATVADPARVSGGVLEQIDQAVADLPQHPDPVHVQRVFFAATFVDRVDGCRTALPRVISESAGDEESVPAFSSMVLVSLAEFATGSWEDARRHADRGVELADRLGYTMLRWAGWYVQALLAAARGEDAQTEAVLAQMGQWAIPRGVLMVKRYMAHVAGLAALGRGDYESAFHSCAAISPPGTFVSHEPFALWVVMDLVEAAERTGRHGAALAHVTAAQAERSVVGREVEFMERFVGGQLDGVAGRLARLDNGVTDGEVGVGGDVPALGAVLRQPVVMRSHVVDPGEVGRAVEGDQRPGGLCVAQVAVGRHHLLQRRVRRLLTLAGPGGDEFEAAVDP